VTQSTKPYEFQREGIRRAWHRFHGRALLAWQMGLGKAQPHDAKVLTPRGWTTIGKIQPGDRITGGDGQPTRVLAVFPQGIKDVYRVTFRDGSWAECCDDHLWSVLTPYRKWSGYPPQLKTLSEIRKDFTHKNGNAKYQIPMVGSVKFRHTRPSVDPYLLGCLLGDGSLSISQGTPAITTADIELIDHLTPKLPTETHFRRGQQKGTGIGFRISAGVMGGARHNNPLTNALRALGVYGHKAETKFIPEVYKFNSETVRVAILQGLLDTDGYVSKSGTLQFCSTSERLCSDLKEIIQSIGGCCRVVGPRRTKYPYKGEIRTGKPSWILTIALPKWVKPFRLSRKATRYRKRPKYQPCRPITKIERVGRKECSCIKIANPDGLYVTNDYVVTHNTPAALWLRKWFLPRATTVVICPATLKENWRREAARHANVRAEVLWKSHPPRGGGLPPARGGFYVINYDILGRVQGRYTRKKDRTWGNLLKDLDPDLIIIDECQMIKNAAAKRSRRVRALCHGVRHVLALGGTGGMESRPIELFNVLNLLRPDVFPSRFDFGLRFCGGVKNDFGGWEFKGATNLPTLSRKMRRTCTSRYRKEDVLDQLPPKTRTIIPFALDDAERAEYAGVHLEALRWLVRGGGLRAAEMVKFNELKRRAARLKLRYVIRWLEDFLESGNKIAVAGTHKKILHPLADHFGRRAVLVDGGVTGDRRQRALDAFNHDKSVRLLLGNTQAAGVGWNCTSTSYFAFTEFGWTPAEHTQFEDRGHGIGRGGNQPLTAYYLVAAGTVEERVARLLQKKQEVLDTVLDGRRVGDFQIYDQLRAEMVREAENLLKQEVGQ
jgi:hypothetical protein